MQQSDDTEPSGPSGTRSNPLATTDVTALDRRALVGLLALIRQIRIAPASFGGPAAAELLRRGSTQRALETETGIPQSTIGRWTAPFRTDAA